MSEANTTDRRRILIVDDEPDLVKGLRLRFQAAGFDVFSAGDGLEAALTAAEAQPDIVVLDIGLPGIDGHEVARRLRSGRATAGIPIVFLTARAGKDDLRLAQEAGAAGYIVKPFRANDLLRKVELVLGAA